MSESTPPYEEMKDRVAFYLEINDYLADRGYIPAPLDDRTSRPGETTWIRKADR